VEPCGACALAEFLDVLADCDISGVTIAAMGRINSHFDKVSRKQTVSSAILWIALWSICIGLGVGMILKYTRNDDHGGLFLGIIFTALSLFNALTGAHVAHAVIRRLVAEARNTH
jgi:hypothetical protein